MANDDPRRHPARTTALTGLIGEVGGGRRAFVDATGASVVVPPTIRRVVATDDRVGALLRVAPVVAVHSDRPAAATADLRALLASVVVQPPAPETVPERPVGPPTTRPQLW